MSSGRRRKVSTVRMQQCRSLRKWKNVIRHAKLNSKNEEPAQSEEAGTAEKKAEKKTDKGQQEKKDKKAAFADRKDNRKGDFRGGFRRDSNPDVIYGRDFEGEPVALETITGEMGEVIVRGQVMEVEAREIRNRKNNSYLPDHRLYGQYCCEDVFCAMNRCRK